MALHILDRKTCEVVTASYAVPDLETAVQQAVYNCIDANAKSVKLAVDIEHASFTIVDDGDGIEPNDLYEYIGECYASSRLPVPKSEHSGQKQRKTYGSRGAFLVELRSLASVVEIESRFHEHWTSYRKVFKDGKVVFNARSNEVRGAPGTKLSVSNLFGKLPVRRKDLSSNNKYRARVIQSIQSFCVSMSMIWPSVSFDVRYEGDSHRPMIITGATSCHERLLQHFGPVLGNDLQYVEFSPETSSFSIRGYFAFIPTGCDGVGHGIKQAKSYYQFVFLGNEWVEECQQLCSRVLTEAALSVSSTIPIFVLKVSAPSDHCDVSLIGKKDGVLFKDPEQFSQFLVEFVQELAATDASHPKTPASTLQPSSASEVLLIRSQREGLALDRPAPSGVHSSQSSAQADHTFNFELLEKLTSHSTEPYSTCYDLPVGVQEAHQLPSSWINESNFWIEQDCFSGTGYDACHACGHVNSPRIIDSAEYQRVETREELNLTGAAQLFDGADIFELVPQGFAPEEFAVGSAKVDLEGIFFSSSSRQTLVERVGRVDTAEGTGTTPWLTSKPDAYDCTDDLLRLCQYDDCGNQSTQSLENEKLGQSIAAEDKEKISGAQQLPRTPGVAESKSNYFDMNLIDKTASNFSKRWSFKTASVKHLAAALHVDNVRILNNDRAVKISRSMLANLQVIRQVDRKFILVKADTSQGKLLLCIDQHAADERVRLEELEADMFNPDGSLRSLETHDYEPALRLRMNFKECETLQHYKELVKNWGFDFELMASNPDQTFLYGLSTPETHEEGHVLLYTTPKVEKRVANADDFRDFIQLLSTAEGRYLQEQIRPPVITRLLHSRACRSAIMFGDRLSFTQCKDLIKDLKTCKLPFQCAHGRPSVVPLAEILSGSFSATSK